VSRTGLSPLGYSSSWPGTVTLSPDSIKSRKGTAFIFAASRGLSLSQVWIKYDYSRCFFYWGAGIMFFNQLKHNSLSGDRHFASLNLASLSSCDSFLNSFFPIYTFYLGASKFIPFVSLIFTLNSFGSRQ